jgi:GDP-L-fucose synthase
MKALITGGTGFLGTHLTKTLKKQGWDVVSLGSKEADLLDPNSLNSFNNTTFDRVFHLAAWTQAGDFCLKHPGEQWLMNQQLNTTVLNWWHKHQAQAKLISMGTSCAYEEGINLVEDRYLAGTPIKDLYCYAMTKRMLLIGQQTLNQQFGLEFLTVIPSTLYGPDYHLGKKQMHFIFDLAWKILSYKYFQKPVFLWGDGQQRRELVFIDDFIATMLELDKTVKNDIVNIGAGEDYTIHEFATTICDVINLDASCIQYDTSKYVGAKSKMLSNAKLDTLLPNRHKTSLKDGLNATLTWLEKEFVKMHKIEKAIA